MINEMIGHFKEENESKYLVLDDADENKEVNGDENVEYGKDY